MDKGTVPVEYRWTDGNDADFHRFYLETHIDLANQEYGKYNN